MARVEARLGGLSLRSVGPAGLPGRIFLAYPRVLGIVESQQRLVRARIEPAHVTR